MKLSFYGAAREVTGSCHFLQACGKNILIDCGMHQGQDEYSKQDIPVPVSQLDYVFLTHAHIDHSGRLPLLAKYGFRGSVYATEATFDLCSIMLKDSAHIQEFEAEWKNRKGKRSGKTLIEPMYTTQDAEAILRNFAPQRYEDVITVCDGITIQFRDVGHLLGSASILVTLAEGGQTRKIVFSGDIGNINQPLIKDPAFFTEADYVVMESTYGTRLHNAPPDYATNLAQVIQRTFDRGGNVVIPSFAVGRTQELLYFLRKIKADHMVKGHGGFEVHVDSPLANAATNIFNENRMDCFDAEAMELVNQGINPIKFDGLKLSISADDSRAINFLKRPSVIISASGMCEAGRIKHHLKHNLWRPESTIVFVGYQAVGTTGRAILDGAPFVKLFGETIEVKAQIEQLEGISGHADQAGLFRFLDAFSPKPRHVFVVHGEDSTCQAFVDLVQERGIRASSPLYSEEHDLVQDVLLREGIVPEHVKPKDQRSQTTFQRLLEAGKRLLRVIDLCKGGANKDLAKFADQINALSDKWGK